MESDDPCDPYFGPQPCSKKKDAKKQEDTRDNCPEKSVHTKDQWSSPCSDVSRPKSLDKIPFPDLSAKEKGIKQDKKPRLTTIKRAGVKKHISSESPDGSKSVQSVFTFDSAVPGKSRLSSRSNKAKGLQSVNKKHAVQSPLESKSTTDIDVCSISTSLSAQSFALSSDSVNASSCANEDDGVFEDYFSPANNQQRPLLLSLPSKTKVQLLFEPSPGKRKRAKSETTEPMSAGAKRKKHEVQSVKETSCESNSLLDHPELPYQDTKGSTSSMDCSRNTQKRCSTRQRTLLFSKTKELPCDPAKQRSWSTDPPHLSNSSLTAASKALDHQESPALLPHQNDSEGKSSQSLRSM